MTARLWLRRIGVLLLIAPMLAVALSMTASFVPDRLIIEELAEAVSRNEVATFFQVGISGRPQDTFSDCIALTMGLGDTEGGPASVWLRSPTLGSCDGAIDSIVAYEAGEGLSGGYEYFRYWHGYTIVSRPLVATVGVSGQRILLFWTAIGALALFARRLWRYHGFWAPIALLGPFLLTTDTVELSRSIPHGVPVVVALLGAWWLHRLSSDEGRSNLEVASAAFLVGSAYLFVDLLTTPPGAWALCTGSAMLAAANHMKNREIALRGSLTAAAWIFGWTWTWVSKWVLAALLLGYDEVRRNIGGAIEDRVGGERDYIELAWFNPIERNLTTWWAHPLTPPVVAGIIVLAVVLARRNDFPATWRTRLLIAAPAAIPLIWFEVLRNHSLVHGFVYRSLGVSAGLIALALIIGPKSLRDVDRTDTSAEHGIAQFVEN